MDNKIRRLCIGFDPKNQFVYFIGGEHRLTINDKMVVIKVCEILQSEKHFLVYVKIESESEIQLWKKLPQNDSTTIEYSID